MHFQHGFRSKRSTQTQLILTIDDLAKNLDVNRQMDMCMLDFSKAFDKVIHQGLMAKLEYYGIRGQTKIWIEKWLTSRMQQVVVDGETYREEIVRSGVPKMTVLGPLMFLIFINDIGYNISSTIRLFADDALIYLSGLVSSVRRALASKLRGPGFNSRPGTVGGQATIIMWGARPGWKLALS